MAPTGSVAAAPDRVSRHRGGIYERFLHVAGRPVLIRAWAAAGIGTDRDRGAAGAGALAAARRRGDGRPTPTSLEAIGRVRHALAVDDDLSDFHAALPPATRCSAR